MERSSPGSPALGSGSFSSEFGRFSSPSLHLKSDLCIMSFPVQSHNNVRCHVFSPIFTSRLGALSSTSGFSLRASVAFQIAFESSF